MSMVTLQNVRSQGRHLIERLKKELMFAFVRSPSFFGYGTFNGYDLLIAIGSEHQDFKFTITDYYGAR